MKLSVFVVSAFVLIASVYGQKKSGECPPLPDIGICEMSCFSDTHCPGLNKCCRTACGGTFCTPPVTPRNEDIQEKPGYCPMEPSGPWVCSSRCSFDADCRGSKKCCRNRCGSMACTRPELY